MALVFASWEASERHRPAEKKNIKENAMAHARKKHFGPGSRGKHDGSGAETDVPVEKIGENMVLSNRDRRSIPTSAARIASRCKQTSFRTTPATGWGTINIQSRHARESGAS